MTPRKTKKTCRSYSCTACEADIKTAYNAHIHPLLDCLVCRKCYKFYGSGDFSEFTEGIDENGDDNYCRWCVDGGNLLVCMGSERSLTGEKCHYAFCEDCIRRNVPEDGDKLFRPDAKMDENWFCYACDRSKLSKFRKEAKEAMKYFNKELAKTTVASSTSSVQQVQPTKSIPTVQPAKPVTPAPSAQPVLSKTSMPSASSVPLVQPTRPVPTVQPAKPTTPAQPTKLVPTVQPAKPTTPAQPTNQIPMVQPTKPSLSAQSTKPSPSAQTAKPGPFVPPSQPTRPSQPAKPSPSAPPAITIPQAQPARQVASTSPASPAQPVPPSPSVPPAQPVQSETSVPSTPRPRIHTSAIGETEFTMRLGIFQRIKNVCVEELNTKFDIVTDELRKLDKRSKTLLDAEISSMTTVLKDFDMMINDMKKFNKELSVLQPREASGSVVNAPKRVNTAVQARAQNTPTPKRAKVIAPLSANLNI